MFLPMFLVHSVVWKISRIRCQSVFYFWRILCWSICANSCFWSSERYFFCFLSFYYAIIFYEAYFLRLFISVLSSSCSSFIFFLICFFFGILPGINAGLTPILNFKVCLVKINLVFFCLNLWLLYNYAVHRGTWWVMELQTRCLMEMLLFHLHMGWD